MPVGDLGGQRGEGARQVGVEADPDHLVLDVHAEVVGNGSLSAGQRLRGGSSLSLSLSRLGGGRLGRGGSLVSGGLRGGSLGLGCLQCRLRLRLLLLACGGRGRFSLGQPRLGGVHGGLRLRLCLGRGGLGSVEFGL